MGSGPTLIADHAYDDNGNRLAVFGEPPASYDDQDRLTASAGITYTYSDAGDPFAPRGFADGLDASCDPSIQCRL